MLHNVRQHQLNCFLHRVTLTGHMIVSQQFLLSRGHGGVSGRLLGQNPSQIPPHNPLDPQAPAQVINNLQLLQVSVGTSC